MWSYARILLGADEFGDININATCDEGDDFMLVSISSGGYSRTLCCCLSVM